MIISLSILVMAVGDAAAAIVGETIKAPRTYRLSSDKKSVQGSITMFAFTFFILAVGIAQLDFGWQGDLVLLAAMAATGALVATAWEAIASKGLDNLTVPLSAAFVLSYYASAQGKGEIVHFVLGGLLALAVAWSAFKLKALAPSGAVATFLLATPLFGVGGWKWSIPIVTFFVLGTLFSKLGRDVKESPDGGFAKGSVRDYGQVFANGGVAGIMVVLSFSFPSFDFYPLYLGSIAAVNADTWSTEIGMMSTRMPRLITNGKTVQAGTNGALTPLGLLAGIAGSGVIALSAFPWSESLTTLGWVAAAGVSGALADSFAGATIQAKYQCPVCGRETEKRTHCRNQPTVHRSGIAWLGNDSVNGICASAGAAFMLIAMVV